ncbi:MAG: GGDEF domain-containing protein [Campylobacterota bacterium]|nr:GGDEF domain-containing protein [Campylobacterota bacterium]
MKHLFLIFTLLATFVSADILENKLLSLNGFDYNTLGTEKYIDAIDDFLGFANLSSSAVILAEDQQIGQLLDMLKLIIKALAVLSIVLILSLIYFIYDNIKFKNQLKTAKKELENSEMKDSLTGLFNKEYFDDIFNIQCNISMREKAHLSFFILEIDNFEKLSQNKTQVEIENLNQKISNLIKLYFKRATDLIFVLEDGVFAGIIVSKEENDTKSQLEKLIDKIKDIKEDTTVSIGFKTNHRDDKLSKESIYTMTKHALLKAKDNKNNSILEFDDILE